MRTDMKKIKISILNLIYWILFCIVFKRTLQLFFLYFSTFYQIHLYTIGIVFASDIFSWLLKIYYFLNLLLFPVIEILFLKEILKIASMLKLKWYGWILQILFVVYVYKALWIDYVLMIEVSPIIFLNSGIGILFVGVLDIRE